MRKHLWVLLALILSLAFSACSSPSGPQGGTWDYSKWDESIWQ